MISTEYIRERLPLALGETHLPLPGRQAGKVRDWYEVQHGQRLIVTTDRLSAFDRILACVPYKGQVLNQLTAWWFDRTRDVIANHKIELPDPNAMIVTTVEPLGVEVVVRGYLTGVRSTALWHRYSLGERAIYGYHFPEGLRKNEQLPEPIITPTTKGGPTGCGELLARSEVVERGLLDPTTWDQLQAAALALFKRGQDIAEKDGLILVDTKYEFGRAPDGSVMLIDEVHTPDSSRFWRTDSYADRLAQGAGPENFDKGLVRLAYAEQGYRGDGPVPAMSDDLWIAVSERYIRIYEMLTEQAFEPGAYPIPPRLLQSLYKARQIDTHNPLNAL